MSKNNKESEKGTVFIMLSSVSNYDNSIWQKNQSIRKRKNHNKISHKVKK